MENCIRAIYMWDVRFEDCPVFQLNNETNRFEMMGDPEFNYPFEEVLLDEDFIVFRIQDDIVTKIKH